MTRPQVEEIRRGGCDLQMMGLSPVGGRPLQGGSSPAAARARDYQHFHSGHCYTRHRAANIESVQEMARRYFLKHFYYDVIIMMIPIDKTYNNVWVVGKS